MSEFTRTVLSLKVLVCSQCQCLLSVPIMLVEDIGNVCKPCFTSFRDTRYSSLKYLQNTALELVLDETTVPCKFAHTGCEFSMRHKYFKEHIETCRFRTINCLLPNSSCSWIGLPKDFTTHFVDVHKLHVLMPRNQLFVLNFDIQDGEYLKLLKTQLTEQFLKIKVDTNNDRIFYSILNEKPNIYNENYIIEHIGPEGENIEVRLNKQLPLDTFDDDDVTTSVDLSFLTEILQNCNQAFIVIKSNLHFMDSKFTDSFECIVCNEIMRPPVYNCESGHSVCHDCHCKLKDCPTCRKKMTTSRNYRLESLVDLIPLACKFKSSGCNEMYLGSQISNHEDSCRYSTRVPQG